MKSETIRSVIALFAAALVGSFLGCGMAASGKRHSALMINGELGTLDTANDPAVERQSELLLNFLKGQIALNNEQPREALAALANARELSEEPSDILQSQLTVLLLQAGDAAGALEESSKIVSSGRSVPNLMLYAGLLEATGRDEEAFAIYEEIVKTDPDFTTPYILMSSIAFMQERPERVEPFLRELARLKPKEISGHFYLAKALLRSGKMAEALRELETAVKVSDYNERLVLDYVRIMLDEGRVSAAKAVLAKSLKQDSNRALSQEVFDQLNSKVPVELVSQRLSFLDEVEEDPTDVRLKLALALVEKNNLDQAARELMLVLAARPEDSRSRYYLGSVLAALGRKRVALEELMKIRKGDAMFIEARTFASFLFRQVDDLEGAEAALRDALQEKPADFNLHLLLIDILRDKEDYREALRAADETLELDPGNEKVLFIKGIIFHDLDRDDDALETMEQVLEKNPDNAQALNYIAYSLADEGKELDRALILVERALELSPEDGFFLDTLGWILFQQGKYTEAESTLSRAVNLTGGDIVIVEHYGDALQKVGKHQKAAVFYNSALGQAGADLSREDAESIERIRGKLEALLRAYPHLSTVVSR